MVMGGETGRKKKGKAMFTMKAFLSISLSLSLSLLSQSLSRSGPFTLSPSTFFLPISSPLSLSYSCSLSLSLSRSPSLTLSLSLYPPIFSASPSLFLSWCLIYCGCCAAAEDRHRRAHLQGWPYPQGTRDASMVSSTCQTFFPSPSSLPLSLSLSLKFDYPNHCRE